MKAKPISKAKPKAKTDKRSEKTANELDDSELKQISGGATGGAGAGKIKFNEFSIKKVTDSASPAFYK